MKIFYFNPNDYSAQYFIISDNEKDAIKKLLIYLKSQRKRNTKSIFYSEILKMWNKAIKEKRLPDKYTLDILPLDTVIHTEIS